MIPMGKIEYFHDVAASGGEFNHGKNLTMGSEA